MHVYICAYQQTTTGPGGIYHFDFNPANGSLKALGATTDSIERASFLAVNAAGTFVLLADELDAGMVRSFKRDPRTSLLELIGSQPTHGADPCYVTFGPEEEHALLTNYTGGSFVVVPVDSDGNLGPADLYKHTGSGPNPDRQGEPHPHMIAPHPIDGQIYVSDLGIDQVVVYDLDEETGKLGAPLIEASATLPAGAGPRHFTFAASGNRLYVIGELSSTITAFSRDEHGSWTDFQTISTLPPDFTGETTCAQILQAPDGRFLYGSNRGHDSIAIFAINEATGRLTALGQEKTQGQTPRNFAIDPTGAWLIVANQDSDTVVVFRRDLETGQLTAHGDPIAIPKPICVVFVD
jgi:6-phosphogluconolactonase